MQTFHQFDAEMAELVEERDVTNSIKENQWSFLDGPTNNGNWSCPIERGTGYIADRAGAE